MPVSRSRIVFGGSREALDTLSEVNVRAINLFLAAWAEKRIYAANSSTLLDLAKELRGEGTNQDHRWLEAARKPLFGLPERAASTAIPPEAVGVDTFGVMKRRYGHPDVSTLQFH